MLDQDHLIKVNTECVDLANTLRINPTTSYCLLKNIVDLKPGVDTVLLSGANSFCGIMLIQFAKLMNVKTVGIVRDRPNFDELAQNLKQLGASAIIRPEELTSFNFLKELNTNKPPVLAIDCVAGELGTNMIKKLGPSGTYVNYGAMSYMPLSVPIGSLIFNDIKVRGFWLSNPDAGFSEDLLHEITKLITDNKLYIPKLTYVNISNGPHGKHAIDEVVEALSKGKTDKKYVLVFNDDPHTVNS